MSFLRKNGNINPSFIKINRDKSFLFSFSYFYSKDTFSIEFRQKMGKCYFLWTEKWIYIRILSSFISLIFKPSEKKNMQDIFLKCSEETQELKHVFMILYFAHKKNIKIFSNNLFFFFPSGAEAFLTFRCIQWIK